MKKSGAEFISIHAPPRGATIRSINAFISFLFQFTPLREGRPNCACVVSGTCADFNSRPSARGDEALRNTYISVDAISIHAPPRGATGNWVRKIKIIDISIHAPPRGATCRRAICRIHRLFQFTPLREGRHDMWRNAVHARSISIHAPPRGATHQRQKYRWRGYYFNSRPSARGDFPIFEVTVCPCLFQFTPLREGRPDTLDASAFVG